MGAQTKRPRATGWVVVLVLVLGALGVLGAWIWSRPENAHERAARAAPDVARTIEPGADGTEGDPAPPSELAADRERASVTAPSALDADAPPSAPPPGTFTIEVRTHEGAPLEGIEVGILAGVWTQPGAYRSIESAKTNAGGDAYLKPFEYRYDAFWTEPGEAPAGAGLRIQCVPPAPSVEGLVVERSIPAGEVLQLVVPADLAQLYRPLIVEVVDAAEAPAAGVEIRLEGERASEPDSYISLGRATTGADGRAAIDLAECRQSRDYMAQMGEVLTFRVAADFPALEAPSHVFGEEVDNTDPVRLQLPATGSVHVELKHEDGTDVKEEVVFGLWARAAGDERSEWNHRVWNTSESGSTVFRNIGLGLDLGLTARLKSSRTDGAQADVAGPVRAGGVVRSELTLGPERPWIKLIAVDEAGRPLAHATLQGELVSRRRAGSPPGSKKKSSGWVRPETDADGIARFQLTGRVAETYTRVLELRQIQQESGQPKTVLRSATVDLSWNPEHGTETDLGRIELRPPPASEPDETWVAGSLLAADGSPIRHANVIVTAFGHDGNQLEGLRRDTKVDPDGRFSIAGPAFAGTLRVVGVASRYLPQTHTRVEPGTNDLELRLDQSARWRGRIVVDPGIPYNLLTLKVRGPNRSRSPDFYTEWVSVDGFTPGAVSIEVETRHGDWLIERVEGLRASVEVEPLDPRVDPLDLRGRLALLRVRLLAPDGEPLGRVSVSVHPPPWPEASVWTERTGWLVLVVPREVGTLRLRPRGYHAVECELLDGEQILTCTPER